ncbi:MAG: hypothetical protein HC812_19715 [Leptolyngbya sp. RL_3_1]|nr:hypothetical protein [Leptolyngbya sp. RL_3_1]
MEFDRARIEPYLSTIEQLPIGRPLSKHDLLIPELRLHQSGNLEIYYVPFDYWKPKAKLLIVGITPGWTQMELAYRSLVAAIAQHKSWSERYGVVEQAASFAGAMRTNLITMLDALGIPQHLGLSSSEPLFGESHHLVNTTSVIRYAVFVDSRNYTGSQPKLLKHPELLTYVKGVFAEELRQVPNALIIPQGKAVQAVLEYWIQTGELDRDRCLLHFPHASGANGHRQKFFDAAKAEMRIQVENWFQVTAAAVG